MTDSNWLKKRTIVYNPPSKSEHRHSSRKSFAGRAWHVIFTAAKRTCTVIGALVLFSAFLSVLTTAALLQGKPLPEEMMLLWPIDGGLSETRRDPGLAGSLSLNIETKPTVHQITRALDMAREDERVKALVVNFKSGGISLAHTEELRTAIRRFRDSGKPALFYASDMTGGLGAYYLASAFDEIWMQPVGTLVIAGINIEEPYIKELLEKIGVSSDFFRRKEYKTVYEPVSNSQMSPANREMLTEVVGELGENISTGIATSRNMSAEQVMDLVNTGLFTDDEALEAGLIDRLDYGDILVNELRENLTGDPANENLQFVSISSYESRAKREAAEPHGFFNKPEARPEAALIYVSGIILPDNSAPSSPLLLEGGIASAEEISIAIKDATDDPSINAIVLRVDSPGGSPTASETIRWAIERAKSKGKPVYVSMGPMAASGGYWVSASADTIFAQPSTLTGSIGVISGKIVFDEMWNKLNVNWEGVTWGEKADMWSLNRPYSAQEAERMNAMVDSIYEDFIAIVAEGRDMSLEQADKVARGYVWSGSRALEVGLVDELGGLDATLDFAARSIGLKDRSELKVRVMPKPKTPAEIVMNLLNSHIQAGEVFKNQAEFIRLITKPILQEAALAQGTDLRAYFPLDAP